MNSPLADGRQQQLGLGLDVPELIGSELQILADLFFRMILEVEAADHFAIERRHRVQHLADQAELLSPIYSLFQIRRIGDVHSIHHHIPRAVPNAYVDLRVGMKAGDCSYEGGEPFRIPQLPCPDCLHDRQEDVVKAILNIVRTQLAHKKVRKILNHAVQFF